jgi:hypothetical protein
VRVIAGADVTGFEDTIDDNGEVRVESNAGLEWSRTYTGTAEAHSELWNIDGIRRIVEPYIAYFNRFALSEEPDELIAIDEIETLDRVEAITFGVRDRIQTHQDGKVATLLDTEVFVPYYPKPDRDNEGENIGLVTLDTRWTPGARITALQNAAFRWRMRFDPNTMHYDESYASFSTDLGEGRRLRISNNKVFHEFNFTTIALAWKLDERWTLATFFQRDSVTNERVKAGVLLRQRLHRWFMDILLEQRRGDSVTTGKNKDESRVSIAFRPAIFDRDQDLTDSIGGRP